MSEQYPETFPYQAEGGELLNVHRRKCTMCGSDVEFPRRWRISINGLSRFTIYGETGSHGIFCGGKCVSIFFWPHYCLYRLQGKL